MDQSITNQAQSPQFSRDAVARIVAVVLQRVLAELSKQYTVAGIAVLPMGEAHFHIDVVMRDEKSETMWDITMVIPPQETERMDALDWNKKFVVLTISRNSLQSIGMHPERVARLTDEDMARIAEIFIAHHVDREFKEDVLFTAKFVLADKRNQ